MLQAQRARLRHLERSAWTRALSLAGGRDVRVEDLFTQEQPAVQAAGLVAAPLAYLMSNDFERVTVEKLEVERRLRRDDAERDAATRLDRALGSRAARHHGAAQGAAAHVPRRDAGPRRSRCRIPASAPAGTYTLLVADGSTLTRLEQREMRQPFVPKDLDQLIRAINGLRRSNHVYARLMRSDDGAIVARRVHAVAAALGALRAGRPSEQRQASSRCAPRRCRDFDLPTDYAVTGSRLLTLTVER